MSAGVAWYWARTELRRRWRAWLAVGLLVGVGGGLALGCLAGARRTQSAYPRFLDRADAPDLVLDPDFGADGDGFLDAVEDLPAVVGRSDATALALGEVADGTVDISTIGAAIASVDGDRFYRRDAVHVLEGRMPDPSSTGEVLVSDTAAAEGVAVGDRIEYSVLDGGMLFGALESGQHVIPADAGERITVEVTGIGVFPELAFVEDLYAADLVLIPPALYEMVPEGARLWTRNAFYLAEGADAGTVQRQISDLAGDHGGDVLFEDRADITRRVQRAVRPYVLALTGLGAAGAVFVTLLAGQLIRRTIARSHQDRAVLAALSADGRLLRLCTTLPALAASGLAVAVALAVTTAMSTSMPIGPIRSVEAGSGAQLDWTVIGPGLAVLVATCLVPAVTVRRRPPPVAPVGSLTSWAMRATAPVPFVLGMARATGTGLRARRSAARSGISSAGLSVVMLAAVVTFGASLSHLVDNPELHGWNADVGVLGAGGYGSFDVGGVAEVDGVDRLSVGRFGNIGIEDDSVPGMELAALRGSLLPPVVEGRAPAGPGEIALGRRTLQAIDASLGDEVDVRLPGEDPAAMVVVGVTVLPGLGPLDNDRPTLGVGALVVTDDEVMGGGGTDRGWSLILADVDDAADPEAVAAALVEAADEQAGETDVLELFRPSDIEAFASIGSVPSFLVGLFGLVAVGSLAHVLLVSARSWRRDRAILSAVGATPGQLRAAVRWQATIVVVIAAVVGLPLGSVLGRSAWRSLAEDIGIVPDAVQPSLVLAAAIAGLLVVALAVTAVQERFVAARRPVEHLRAE